MSKSESQLVATISDPKLIDEIRELEQDGILYPESCPEPGYWHWTVKRSEDLPDKFKNMVKVWGEIRWHGGFTHLTRCMIEPCTCP